MKTFTTEHCAHTFELCRAKCRPCSGLDKTCPEYEKADAPNENGKEADEDG